MIWGFLLGILTTIAVEVLLLWLFARMIDRNQHGMPPTSGEFWVK